MSLIDISEALAGGSPRAARRCKLGRLLDAVPAEQAAELERRLAGTEWSAAAITRLINSTPLGPISSSAVNNHTSGLCSCERVAA